MPHSNGLFYEFDCYRLDVGRRVLVRTGEAVSLTPKATEILIMLVSRAGDLVEKDELISQVWPDSFVEEANVSQNIFTLRRALGDERVFPRFIETVAKRGYRFIAPVQTIQSEPVTVVEAVEPSGPPTLAVLPLLNTTKDPAVEYLVDGLTDNIINSLSGLSTLRVMSRTAVARYKRREVDLRETGRDLGVDVILLGKIDSRKTGMVIRVELVDVKNGWQLWGETFDCSKSDILEIQDRILKQLLSKLKLKLTGDEEKRITARYTESGEAYQSYLEGRYHWSQYTRKGIEKAIGHFRRAIEMDANYALAYAGIVDCYLRLATNYLPPEDELPMQGDQVREVDRAAEVDRMAEANRAAEVDAPTQGDPVERATEADPAKKIDESAADPNVVEEVFDSGADDFCENSGAVKEVDSRVKLRHEWDWKGAERELRRASELKAEYPSAHQWYAAYLFARRLFEESEYFEKDVEPANQSPPFDTTNSIRKPNQIASLDLTKTEQIQVFCTIAREQLEVGNYDAADLMLRTLGLENGWPLLKGLAPQSAGDLLFTVGLLIGNQAASGRLEKGHRHAHALLNGAVAIFEQISLNNRSAEARIEIGRCFYREGLFELSAENLVAALRLIDESDPDLRTTCLVVFGAIEREAGRLTESLQKLNEASQLCVPRTLTAFRCYFELATTLKSLALVEENPIHAEAAAKHFKRAIHECDAIGNHLFEANVRNNLGFLLVNTGEFEEAEFHLLRSRHLFATLGDEVRAAVVNDTLAQLYVAMKDYERAWVSIEAAVKVLERNDSEAMLTEALVTKGLVASRLNQASEALKILQGARKVAERCGFQQEIARILLILHEGLFEHLQEDERQEIIREMTGFAERESGGAYYHRIKKLLACVGHP